MDRRITIECRGEEETFLDVVARMIAEEMAEHDGFSNESMPRTRKTAPADEKSA